MPPVLTPPPEIAEAIDRITEIYRDWFERQRFHLPETERVQ
jgi:hypothetical protein